MARATTNAEGSASFGLQYPGFAYCVVEHQAPMNYLVTTTAPCSAVLAGSPEEPAVATTLTLDDTEATVTLSAHKFNVAVPDTNIVGAVYDLYVEGAGPPAPPADVAPDDVVTETGDAWFKERPPTRRGTCRFGSLPGMHGACAR